MLGGLSRRTPLCGTGPGDHARPGRPAAKPRQGSTDGKGRTLPARHRRAALPPGRRSIDRRALAAPGAAADRLPCGVLHAAVTSQEYPLPRQLRPQAFLLGQRLSGQLVLGAQALAVLWAREPGSKGRREDNQCTVGERW